MAAGPETGAADGRRAPPKGARRLYELLAGLPLSFVLMAALGLLLAVRALVAQKGADLGEANALIRWATRVAPDDPGTLLWPTVAVIVLFVVNLALSSVEMTKKAAATRSALAAPRGEERLAGVRLRTTLAGALDAGPRLAALLEARGWRVVREEREGRIALAAGRRQAGHWTTLLFHLSFFVILLGALLSVLTRFTGYFELAPGEHFVEAPGAYLRRTAEPLLFDGYRGFRLELGKMELAFWPEGGVRERASRVRLLDARGALRVDGRLAVNDPIDVDGLSVYQAGREGFIAGISAVDSAGTRAAGTVHLPFPERPGDPMRGVVQLPGTPLRLALELRTGMLSQLTGELAPTVQGSDSYLRLYERRGPHERYLGSVVGGGTLAIQGLTLSFDSLKPFMSFQVVRDRGTPLIFAGLAVALLALVALYFWVPENLWAVVEPEGPGARIVLAGASDRYPGSFAARFHELEQQLARALAD
jgi:cytochrome c biogenesis protein ResB